MQTLSLLFSLAWRNLWRNQRRTLVIMFAIVLGVWAMIVMGAFARGIAIQMFENAVDNMTGHLQIHRPGYLDDPVIDHRIDVTNETIQKALKSDEIESWAPRIRVPAAIASEFDSNGVTLVGIDPSAEAKLSFLKKNMSEGRYLEGPDDNGIIIGKKLAQTLETGIGKRVVVMTQDKNNQIADRGFRVVGIFDTQTDATEKAFAFIAIGSAQRLLNIEGEVSEIVMRVKKVATVETYAETLKSDVPGLDIATWQQLEPLNKIMIEMYDGMMIVWHLIIFLAMGFGIINTLLMAVFERTREFGLFQALGLKPSFILRQVWIEAFLLLALGLIIGNIVSWLTVLSTGDGIDVSAFSQGMEMAGMANIIPFIIVQKDLILANSVVVILGMLTSLYPAWRASRLVPADAITRV